MASPLSLIRMFRHCEAVVRESTTNAYDPSVPGDFRGEQKIDEDTPWRDLLEVAIPKTCDDGKTFSAVSTYNELFVRGSS